MTKISKEGSPQRGSRRQFFFDLTKATIGLAGVGLVSVSVGQVQAESTSTQQEQLPSPLSKQIPQDELVFRMQRELYKAIQKPVNQRQWAMVIDLRKCVGCSSCTVACKAENKLPPGVVYRPVIEEEYGTFPNVARRFLPRPCMHCSHPQCVKVCPVAATYKQQDGIVVIDYDKCIGCRYCISACPYGARTFDWGEYYTKDTPVLEEYELEPAFEYGRKRARVKNNSPINNTRKCHFCLHRLNVGMLPMCVTTCIGRSSYFGDKNDPESWVSKLIGGTRVIRLKEELGTEPNVYYLL